MYHNTQHDGESREDRNKKLNNMFIYLFIYLFGIFIFRGQQVYQLF